MIPKIALFGRPNVGKSSLINRLLRDRVQIVSNIAGTTVDLVFRAWNSPFGEVFLVDTVGVETVRDLKTAFNSIQPSVNILVCEFNHQLLPIEDDFRRFLFSTGVPTVTVMNKVDLVPQRDIITPHTIPVSAKTGYGIHDLVEKLEGLIRARSSITSQIAFSLALVGRTNVGKSSIFNILAGRPVAKVSPEAHTTRDFLEALIRRDGKIIRVVDCAGFKKGLPKSQLESYVEDRTSQAIKLVDIVGIVLSAADGVTNFDRRLITRIINAGKPFIVVFNKWDLVPDQVKRELQKVDKANLLPAYVPTVFTSAVTKKNVWKLVDLAESVLSEFRDLSKINLLREVCLEISRAYPPPFRGNKPNLLKQVDIETQSRWVIKLSFTFPELVKNNYLRHFEKQIRRRVPLIGIPLKIEMIRRQLN